MLNLEGVKHLGWHGYLSYEKSNRRGELIVQFKIHAPIA